MRADYFGISSEKDQDVNEFLLQPDLVKRGHNMKTWFLCVAFCILFKQTCHLKHLFEPYTSLL